ncbi:RidA family protein [Thermoactinospora rubra]|uniref:RidA family protein n=1 Tax=Thermoactinospora rubra TaxID=1088767 RepID=UPI000A111CB3|nr:RidA family protein [Thermoactinospora rubra]
MTIQPVDPADVPAGGRSYAQGALVEGASRVLYISGQVPETADGHIPAGFADQCRLAWRNVCSVLAGADMTVANLAKVTVFLSDRKYREENARIRDEVLGDHRPALTVIVTDIWSEDWLLEIEAVAVA